VHWRETRAVPSREPVRPALTRQPVTRPTARADQRLRPARLNSFPARRPPFRPATASCPCVRANLFRAQSQHAAALYKKVGTKAWPATIGSPPRSGSAWRENHDPVSHDHHTDLLGPGGRRFDRGPGQSRSPRPARPGRARWGAPEPLGRSAAHPLLPAGGSGWAVNLPARLPADPGNAWEPHTWWEDLRQTQPAKRAPERRERGGLLPTRQKGMADPWRAGDLRQVAVVALVPGRLLVAGLPLRWRGGLGRRGVWIRRRRRDGERPLHG
jgi:hypothetical protein